MKNFILFFVTIALYHNVFSANHVKMTKDNGYSSFIAIGNPSAIRIEGKGDAPEGTLTINDTDPKNLKLSGEIKMNLKSYSTGIDLRDRHMKEKYFEVEKFETASILIENFEIEKALLISDTEKQVSFNAILDFHGIKKPIQGLFLIKKINSKIQVNSAFTIKISDFNMSLPTFAGIKVADSVEVKTFNLIEQF